MSDTTRTVALSLCTAAFFILSIFCLVSGLIPGGVFASVGAIFGGFMLGVQVGHTEN